MKLLPSETNARGKKIIEELGKMSVGSDCKKLYLSEPCDCGSHIRHNNGGNYHDEVVIAFDNGKYYIKYETTSELSEPSEWEEIALEQLLSLAKKFAEQGM